MRTERDGRVCYKQERYNTRCLQLACAVPPLITKASQPTYQKSFGVDALGRQGVKTVNHVVVRLAGVELRMFLSEAPYWSRAPRQGYWTSQRRLAINVISDGKLDSSFHRQLCIDICVNVMLHQIVHRPKL